MLIISLIIQFKVIDPQFLFFIIQSINLNLNHHFNFIYLIIIFIIQLASCLNEFIILNQIFIH